MGANDRLYTVLQPNSLRKLNLNVYLYPRQMVEIRWFGKNATGMSLTF